MEAASPRDIGPAAAAFPNIKFVVYHSGYERDPVGQEGPYDPANATRGVDRLIKSVERAGIGSNANVYAELGSTWFLMLRRPVEAAHVLGKLLVALGPERIVWGTDSTWYGSPQPLIDAFRAFRIPPRMQEQFGYPALTAADKERILSTNAQELYGVSDDALHAADREARSLVGRQRRSAAQTLRSRLLGEAGRRGVGRLGRPGEGTRGIVVHGGPQLDGGSSGGVESGAPGRDRRALAARPPTSAT